MWSCMSLLCLTMVAGADKNIHHQYHMPGKCQSLGSHKTWQLYTYMWTKIHVKVFLASNFRYTWIWINCIFLFGYLHNVSNICGKGEGVFFFFFLPGFKMSRNFTFLLTNHSWLGQEQVQSTHCGPLCCKTETPADTLFSTFSSYHTSIPKQWRGGSGTYMNRKSTVTLSLEVQRGERLKRK